MSRRPVVMHSLLRAVARFGPECSNKQITQITRQQTWAVSMLIKRAQGHGYIRVEKLKGRRLIHITENGYTFLSQGDEKPIHTGIVTKPSPAYQGEAKRRACLMCKGAFNSLWPGHRVCDRCKSTDLWQSPAAAQQTLQESGK